MRNFRIQLNSHDNNNLLLQHIAEGEKAGFLLRIQSQTFVHTHNNRRIVLYTFPGN